MMKFRKDVTYQFNWQPGGYYAISVFHEWKREPHRVMCLGDDCPLCEWTDRLKLDSWWRRLYRRLIFLLPEWLVVRLAPAAPPELPRLDYLARLYTDMDIEVSDKLRHLLREDDPHQTDPDDWMDGVIRDRSNEKKNVPPA